MELLLPDARRVAPHDLLGLYDAAAPYVRAGMVTSLDGAATRGVPLAVVTRSPEPGPLVLGHLLREQSTLLGRWLVA